MYWHDLLPVAVFLATFISSAFSGMAGGGGSFIILPFYILIGLTPQQTIATAKFGSFGLTAGAVAAFKKRMLDNKRLSLFIMALSGLAGFAASILVVNISNKLLQQLIALLILAMIPFMLLKRTDSQNYKPSSGMRSAGVLILAVVLFLQAAIGGGVGALVSTIFIIFFGASALEANVLKRKASLFVNVAVVAGLLGSGLINFEYGFLGMAGGFLGGYFGSKQAIKRGEDFARYTLLIFMFVSGIWLLLTAK